MIPLTTFSMSLLSSKTPLIIPMVLSPLDGLGLIKLETTKTFNSLGVRMLTFTTDGDMPATGGLLPLTPLSSPMV